MIKSLRNSTLNREKKLIPDGENKKVKSFYSAISMQLTEQKVPVVFSQGKKREVDRRWRWEARGMWQEQKITKRNSFMAQGTLQW